MINKEYINKIVSIEPYTKPHQKYIYSILMSFFFVSILPSHVFCGITIDGRRKFKYEIKFGGTKENVEIAIYVNNFLEHTFLSLWAKYKKENSLSESHRNTYMLGLFRGISETLKISKESVKEEYASNKAKSQSKSEQLSYENNYQLALKHFDAVTSSKEITAKAFPDEKIVNKSSKVKVSSAGHLDNGYNDGKKVSIRKGLDSDSSDSGKYLK